MYASMMKHKCILTSLLFAWMLSTLISCKPEATTTEDNPPQEILTATPAEDPADTTSQSLVENMPWTFLTHKIFHNRATVVSGQVGVNPKEGHWIDLKENGTFDYGIWGEKTASGTWKYDNSTRLLELHTSGKNAADSEWRTMHKDDNLILVGTATYGNNTNQEQWVRRDELPDKNAKPRHEED
jgi:hypothetical protein